MDPAAPLAVCVNGWFSGARVGSGIYAGELVDALRALDNRDIYRVATPVRRGDLAKVGFEHWRFPRSAAGATVALVPYWGPPIACPVPVVVTVHDLIPLVVPEYGRSLKVRLYTRLAIAGTRRAGAVIADSEHTARDIRARLGVDSERVHVVPLGVRPAANDAADLGGDVAHVPERYGLYLGGFDVRKNVATLVCAWRGVYEITRVPLVLAGAAGPEVRALAGPGPEFRFVGEVSDAEKAALYRSASVLAYPSLYEGFGLPPLEAMSAGVPVVASRASSLPEVVGDAGILVAPMNQAEWVHAIARVLTDPGLAAELAERGRSRAAAFTWEATARRTRAVLAGIASRGEGR